MLTARAGQEASVEGLDAGADDYLAKPFRADELIARVRVVARAGSRTGRHRAPPDVPPPSTPHVPGGHGPTPPGRRRSGPDRAPVPGRPRTGPPTAPGRGGCRRRPPRSRCSGGGCAPWLAGSAPTPDQAYDLLLAACEAATNAIEHAQEPSEPFIDVTRRPGRRRSRISVRDYGQWRERVPVHGPGPRLHPDERVRRRHRDPGPAGTTVVISSALSGERPGRRPLDSRLRRAARCPCVPRPAPRVSPRATRVNGARSARAPPAGPRRRTPAGRPGGAQRAVHEGGHGRGLHRLLRDEPVRRGGHLGLQRRQLRGRARRPEHRPAPP